MNTPFGHLPMISNAAKHFLLSLALLGASLALASGSAAEEPVGYAYQDRTADAATIIAVEKGFFRSEGLVLASRMFSSGPRCAEALTSGRAVFGTLDDTTAVITATRHPGAFRIVCAQGGGRRRHRIVASPQSGIRRPEDLAGKRIGVRKRTSAHGGLMRLARQLGLDPAPSLVDGNPSFQLTALAAGQLDAIVASEPTPSQAEAGGYGRAVATLDGLGSDYPMVTAVRARFARKRPKAVIRVLRALNRAALFIKAEPDEAARVLARLARLPVTTLRRIMKVHYYRVEYPESVRHSLQETARLLLASGEIPKMPDLDRSLDNAFLKEAKDNR